jgi:hypothetical protein
MKQPRKIYEPVREFEWAVTKAEGQRLNAKVSGFEQKTSYCPRKTSNFADASMDRSPRGRPLYLAGKQMLKAKG